MLRRLSSLVLALCACTRPNPAYESGGEETGSTTSATDASLTATSGSSITTSDEPATASADESGSGGEMPNPCRTDIPDLAACYHFPAGETAILVDGSSDPIEGTIDGLNALIGAPAGFDYAADVGLDTRITVPETGAIDDLDVTSEISFMALFWRRDGPLSGPVSLLDKQGQYALSLDGRGIPICWVAGGEVFASIAPLPPQTWWHVACTYDGATIAMFVNGAQVADATHRGPIAVNEGPLELAGNSPGKDNPNPERLDGHIDAVEVWSRALHDDEICERALGVCPN